MEGSLGRYETPILRTCDSRNAKAIVSFSLDGTFVDLVSMTMPNPDVSRTMKGELIHSDVEPMG